MATCPLSFSAHSSKTLYSISRCSTGWNFSNFSLSAFNLLNVFLADFFISAYSSSVIFGSSRLLISLSCFRRLSILSYIGGNCSRGSASGSITGVGASGMNLP
ncbi:hypothetical protein AA313_de0205871 [Arthrobotrys entomopaga]|nr:hypothetical protein AA313_de0205871 [Arthrobotrys entomopaga]